MVAHNFGTLSNTTFFGIGNEPLLTTVCPQTVKCLSVHIWKLYVNGIPYTLKFSQYIIFMVFTVGKATTYEILSHEKLCSCTCE